MQKHLLTVIILLVFILSILSVDAAVYQKPKKSMISPFDKGICKNCVSKSVSKSTKTVAPKASKKSVPVKRRIRCEDFNVFNPGKHFLADCSRCPTVSSCTGPVKLNAGNEHIRCFVCKLRSEQ